MSHVLTAMVASPALAALVVLVLPPASRLTIRFVSLVGALASAVFAVVASLQWDKAVGGFQLAESFPLVPSLGIAVSFAVILWVNKRSAVGDNEGGRPRAVHVIVDPDKLAKYENLTIEDVRQALIRENREDPGGRVDRLSCTAQLLYEIEDPARYLQPDVVADFSQVQLHDLGADRVRVSGASGGPRPAQLKATLGYRDGYIGEGQISYAGPGARARGEMALAILEQRLKRRGLAAREHRAELIGVNAMHGPLLGTAHEPYEVRVRLAVRCATQAEAEIVGQEVEALYLNGPAAGGGVTQSVREVIAAASALIPREAVYTHCQILEL